MSKGVEWDRIRRLIEEVVESQGYELVEAELKGGGNNSVLRIFIDKSTGISHHDCELVSEQVGTVLDVEDLIPSSYTLEVSSPGLERKLVKDSDYTRFDGKLAVAGLVLLEEPREQDVQSLGRERADDDAVGKLDRHFLLAAVPGLVDAE